MHCQTLNLTDRFQSLINLMGSRLIFKTINKCSTSVVKNDDKPQFYSTGQMNGWHLVQITWSNTTNTFTWYNHAGFSWSLTPIPKGNEDYDTTKLKVGPECPYFKKGHKKGEFAAVEWEGQPGYSDVSTIKGPWEEAYLRQESCGSLPGGLTCDGFQVASVYASS